MAKINKYNYKPTPKFFGTPHLGVYLGVELELDVRGCTGTDTCPIKLDVVEKVEDILGDFVYFKHDGSINGVEIVSHPASLLIHRRRWKKFFDELPDEFQVSNRDGLHVHATRTGLTKHQLWEIHSFITSQAKGPGDIKCAAPWLKNLAGRDFTCTCKRIVKPEATVTRMTDNGKYEAVNLVPNSTMEFRLFAATTDYKAFMLRLEFAAALVQAAQQISASLNLQSFKSFLRQHPKRFPVLVPWIEKNT